MSLYDDELLDSNKDGSGKGLSARIIDRFVLLCFVSRRLVRFDQITSRICSREEISSTTTIESKRKFGFKLYSMNESLERCTEKCSGASR